MVFPFITLSVIQICVFCFGTITQINNDDLRVLNKIKISVYISRGAGLCLSILPSIIILPMCKKTMSFLSKYYRKLPGYLLDIHRSAAFLLLIFSYAHSISHYINFFTIEQNKIINSTMVTLHYHTIAGISGHFLVLSMILLYFFSKNSRISQQYTLFSIIHQVSYSIFCIAFIFHGLGCFVKGVSGTCYPYYSSLLIALPLMILFIEKIILLFIKSSKVKSMQSMYSGKIIILRKTFDYEPGQYVLVCIEEAGKNEWHPISISSCISLTPDNLELCIKENGDWSSIVRSLNIATVKIQGPFYSPCCRHIDYENVIFIASGIGITSFIAIIKDFSVKYISSINPNVFKKKMDVYWVSRKRDDKEWFESIFSDILSTIPSNVININIYITEPVIDPEIVKEIHYGNNPNFDNILNTNTGINYNRPNFDKILSEYSTKYTNCLAGVFVCGNDSIIESVDKAAKKYSNKNVKFDTIHEVFLM
jgi:NADPH oxidase